MTTTAQATTTTAQATTATAHAVRPARREHQARERAKAFVKKDKVDIVTIIGRIASVLSVIMYVSYISQIMANLGGHPGTPWQPLAAFFNCVMWTAYGFPRKDWPIVVANVPGIFLAAITFVTSFS